MLYEDLFIGVVSWVLSVSVGKVAYVFTFIRCHSSQKIATLTEDISLHGLVYTILGRYKPALVFSYIIMPQNFHYHR